MVKRLHLLLELENLSIAFTNTDRITVKSGLNRQHKGCEGLNFVVALLLNQLQPEGM